MGDDSLNLPAFEADADFERAFITSEGAAARGLSLDFGQGVVVSRGTVFAPCNVILMESVGGLAALGSYAIHGLVEQHRGG